MHAHAGLPEEEDPPLPVGQKQYKPVSGEAAPPFPFEVLHLRGDPNVRSTKVSEISRLVEIDATYFPQ